MNKIVFIGLAISVLTLSGINNAYAEKTKSNFSEFVDDKGNISFPKDFRKTMVHLGSWFVPTGEASGFHDVYTRQIECQNNHARK